MSTHRFVVVAHTDPVPGHLHTPESLGDAIAASVRAIMGSNIDSVEFLVMDLPTDAGDFHEFSQDWGFTATEGECKCGERKDHPVHTMPHQWGGTDGSCGPSPCVIPDCQQEKHSVIHQVPR